MSGDLSSLVKKGKHLGESLSLNRENRLAGEEGEVFVALLVRLGRILVRFGRVSLLQNRDNHIAEKERQVSFALLVRFRWASFLQNRENRITAALRRCSFTPRHAPFPLHAKPHHCHPKIGFGFIILAAGS
ncbi:hypothetical protein AAC387_Pa06g0677 [Persea americana]